jgi:gliding motility-associated-like protein
VFGDPTDPNTVVSGLSQGVNEFVWTVYNGPCAEPSSDTMTITVFDPESPDATAGADQFLCTPDDSVTLDANAPIAPAQGTWTVISGDVTLADDSDPNSVATELGLGENILVWSIYNGACDNSLTTDTVSIFVNDASVADADAGPDQHYCGPVDQIQLQGSETIGNTATGVWTILEGSGTFANVENEFSLVFDLPVGVHTYVWSVDNLECGSSADTVSIFVYDPEIDLPYAGEGAEICEDEFMSFDLNAVEPDYPAVGYWSILEGPIVLADENDANSEVITLGNAPDLGSMVSVIAWNVDNGVCGTIADTIAFSLDDCLTIKIPDAFSPNDDFINDFWVIPNLESYPNNSVKIFNRWGAQVYEASPYLNNWDGKSDHPSALGGLLPVSTYYFILDLGDGTEPFTGDLYLKR